MKLFHPRSFGSRRLSSGTRWRGTRRLGWIRSRYRKRLIRWLRWWKCQGLVWRLVAGIRRWLTTRSTCWLLTWLRARTIWRWPCWIGKGGEFDGWRDGRLDGCYEEQFDWDRSVDGDADGGPWRYHCARLQPSSWDDRSSRWKSAKQVWRKAASSRLNTQLSVVWTALKWGNKQTRLDHHRVGWAIWALFWNWILFRRNTLYL